MSHETHPLPPTPVHDPQDVQYMPPASKDRRTRKVGKSKGESIGARLLLVVGGEWVQKVFEKRCQRIRSVHLRICSHTTLRGLVPGAKCL